MTRFSISEAGQDPRAKASAKNEPGIGRDALAFNPLHPSMELPPEQLIQHLNMGNEKTRNRIMTRSPSSKAGQDPRPKAGAKKKPGTGRAALAFNPLHPSMELPPEQLIRLLSMASKKTRKQMRKRAVSDQDEPRSVLEERKPQTSPAPPTLTEEHSSAHSSGEKKPGSPAHREKPPLVAAQKTSQAPAKERESLQVATEERTQSPTRRQKRRSASGGNKAPASGDQQQSRARAAEQTTRRTEGRTPPPGTHSLPGKHNRRRSGHAEYQREKPATFDKRGPGWLLLALVVGLVSGAALSAYLFWHLTSSPDHQKIASPPISDENRKPQAAKQPPTTLVKRKPAPASGKAKTLPAQAPAPAKAARSGTDAEWQAATEKQQLRLRKAAEQRLSQQRTRMQVEHEQANLQATPANHAEPATVVTPPAAAEPTVVEQAVVPAPEPAATDTLAAPQAGIELTGADDAAEPAVESKAIPAPPPLQDVAPAEHDEIIAQPAAADEPPEEYGVPQIAPAVGASDVAPTGDGGAVLDTEQSVDSNPLSDDSAPAQPDSEPVELTTTDDESETEQSASSAAVESQVTAAEDSDSF